MPLSFEHVTYRYGSEAPGVGPALNDVTFSIADGEFVGVIGHTGSGKSTLAELTNGLKVPTGGRVLVDGIPTADKKTRRDLRRRVGYVMQYPEYQLFAETVREDVGFGPRNLGQTDAEIDRSVREAIELVGLDFDEIADASPFDLSGGQKRRVAMAGIIAMHPHILTLDEPTAGLDPRGRNEVLDIIRELHRRGTTIIMVSHSMDDVAEIAGHIVVLDHGRLADEGDPDTVFSHEERLRAIGLDVPRAVHVAHDLAARGFELPRPCPLTLDSLARAIAAQLGAIGRPTTTDAPQAGATPPAGATSAEGTAQLGAIGRSAATDAPQAGGA
jgi:energy-coupling factor transport system ATP-binding protein